MTLEYTSEAPMHLRIVERNNPKRIDDQQAFELINAKLFNKFRLNLLSRIKLHWEEIYKLKSRVDGVVSILTLKLVRKHMQNEIKKQLVKSKRLKMYFEEHETEKEVLLKSIEEESSLNRLFKHLEFIPDYCMPKAIIMDSFGEEGAKTNNGEYAPTSSNVCSLV